MMKFTNKRDWRPWGPIPHYTTKFYTRLAKKFQIVLWKCSVNNFIAGIKPAVQSWFKIKYYFTYGFIQHVVSDVSIVIAKMPSRTVRKYNRRFSYFKCGPHCLPGHVWQIHEHSYSVHLLDYCLQYKDDFSFSWFIWFDCRPHQLFSCAHLSEVCQSSKSTIVNITIVVFQPIIGPKTGTGGSSVNSAICDETQWVLCKVLQWWSMRKHFEV